ncbi:hypothetical protein CWB41_12800 [Methylovirgula ligni]|uniref:hypothetical protein n=1 Tax=Methylovirgula ligni TaxID=569860 RepID=UPI000E26288E|nr:hypothetical protein [Methylovirgula ligni]QAY96502.1 hypothetical protein CWB41_12800 [Methylovirgula ligni]
MAISIDRIRGALPGLAMVVAFGSLTGGPAWAQSQNGYGLNDLKPYAGTLDAPAQASKAPSSAATAASRDKPPPGSAPIVSLHMFGGAFVNSRIGR